MKNKCVYCDSIDEKNLCIDHIIPKSRGGGNKLINYQTLCRKCNSIKRTKTNDEMEIYLSEFKILYDNEFDKADFNAIRRLINKYDKNSIIKLIKEITNIKNILKIGSDDFKKYLDIYHNDYSARLQNV